MDRKTIKWLLKTSKKQHIAIIFLIVFNVLLSLCNVLFALACRNVIDAVNKDVNQLFLRGTMLLGVILLMIVLRLVCQSMSVRITARLEMNYRANLLRAIIKKDYATVTKHHSGELMTYMTSDIAIITEGITSILPNVAGMITRIVGAFSVLCVMDLTFAVIFVVGGILVFFVTLFFRRIVKKLHRKVQETDGKARSFMQEAITNLLVVKIFNIEKEIDEKTEVLQEENFKAKMKRRAVSIAANCGFSFVFHLGYLYALMWSAYKVAINAISFGTLTATLQLVSQIQSPFSSLSGILPRFYGILASAERIMEIENMPEEAPANKEPIDVKTVYENLQSIEFENVTFAYDRDLVIDDASLTVNKGDFIAIAGISGIGKSTLLKLLLGVFTQQSGEIFLKLNNGETIYTDKFTRKLFAYVPQGNLLLSGKIRDNLCIINKTATDEDIKKAIKVSCAESFIDDLPNGLDTVIGEKGLGLSEGQVQRLAIARAILSNAPILLLDEATSALDEQTEKQLLENIQNLNDKTCIIISHKKAALDACDKEVIIRDGKIYTIDKKTLNA